MIVLIRWLMVVVISVQQMFFSLFSEVGDFGRFGGGEEVVLRGEVLEEEEKISEDFSGESEITEDLSEENKITEDLPEDF
jgi:hypothetical protein